MKSQYFTENHELFRKSVRDFVAKEITPYGDTWEIERQIPKSLLKKLGDQGYLGINHKEAYGGSNIDFFYSVAYIEEICKSGYSGISGWITVHQYMAISHLAEAGSEALKQKYLVPAISGDLLGAIAFTEPCAGSDVAAILTTAVRDGNDYIINGSKTFITNGVYSDFVDVGCKTDPKAGVNGISLIVVDRSSKGFTATKLNKMGLHSSDTAELAFDNVRVPVTNLVGNENEGFFYIMESFQIERLVAGIMSNAAAEQVLEITLKYMDERETFGRKLKKYQVLRHIIVNMYTELEAAKQLVYSASWKYQNGIIPVKECSMVKLHCTELAKRIIDNCFQMFGGYAFMEDYPIARAYRDARVGTIVGGTSEIMREILAKIIIDDIRYKKVYNENEEDSSQPTLTAQEILASLPDRLKKDKANGASMLLHFDLFGENGGQFSVQVKDGNCTVEINFSGEADCIISAEASIYEDLELGRLNPELAVMGGKIKISNLMTMMAFSKLFKKVNT